MISVEDASRALYIDFEGETGKAPVLLGCANRLGRGAKPWVWQAVTGPLFGPLAAADGIELLSLAVFVPRREQMEPGRELAIDHAGLTCLTTGV